MVLYTVVRREGDSRAAKDDASRRALARLLPFLGEDPAEPLAHDAEGRPVLPRCTRVRVSVTHAEPFTAVAVGRSRVGIDLEHVEAVRDPAGLVRRFFTDGERAEAERAPDLAVAACEIWTRKEAMAKYTGAGLAATLRDGTEVPPVGTAFYVERWQETDGRYLLTVCSHEPPQRI